MLFGPASKRRVGFHPTGPVKTPRPRLASLPPPHPPNRPRQSTSSPPSRPGACPRRSGVAGVVNEMLVWLTNCCRPGALREVGALSGLTPRHIFPLLGQPPGPAPSLPVMAPRPGRAF